MPGIEIQDISLEENTQLFEKLVQGFGKLGVVTKLLNPPPPSHHNLSKLIFFKFEGSTSLHCASPFISIIIS